MIVIGADTHKSTHALAAVDTGTGEVRGEREIAADEDGHRQALRRAHEIDPDVVWALEDCRHVSHHLERALVSSGERVIRVTPRLMGQTRRGEREFGKSDQIDARAVVREGVEKFPGAHLDEQAMEIRLLCDHRDNQVGEITRLTNRLRWNLVILDPALEASIPARKVRCSAGSKRDGTPQRVVVSTSIVAMKAFTLGLVTVAAIASLPTVDAQARTRRCGVITTTNHAGGSARWVVTVASGAVSCTTARRVLSQGLSLSGGGNPRGWQCGPPATGPGLRCSRGPSVIVARR